MEELFDESESDAIAIRVRPTKAAQCRCGHCNRKSPGYDAGNGLRRLRCSDIGSTKVYIEAEAPRVDCKTHGVATAAVPWARDTRFCKPFEDTAAWLVTHTAKAVVSELMRIEWHTVGGLCNRVYKELETQATSRFDGLVKPLESSCFSCYHVNKNQKEVIVCPAAKLWGK